ncbi:SdiA-regulated domain-containing protein [Fluviicola taffensis]|uniref:Uncharacterized protein n=1 Tax=Fluviicola taffensis (strain DSM 16823 / NCIMB 13979 / RW262) TaxID=755732 RepID=F2IH87_FLUTR|nr:SdiA-regulated domain-containing protein [Fluviicola taffensis]AEA42642.1 hypothetical protein Fluta_0638 [Fluviicola taffensis DSM 16823]
MKCTLSLLLFVLLKFNFGFAQVSIPYNLKQEKETIILPNELREISGLTIIDSKTLACVQDEEGIAFIYDLSTQKVIRKIDFAGPGDYEGIAPVGKDLYILRSDGELFQIQNFTKSNPKIDSIATGIPNKDNEGLCFDKENKRLLIGSKSKIAKGAAFKNIRTIYAFDYTKKKLQSEPIYSYDITVIKDFAQNQGIELPTKQSKKNPEEQEVALKFQLSGIYIHPTSKLLYVLSASDFYLFVFNHKGEIQHLEILDPVKFNKAEGIAIMPNGDLYVSNEGQAGLPKILLFSENKKK